MSGIVDAIGQTLGGLLGLPAVGAAAQLLLLALTVLWLATAWWAWRDMETRTGDPLLRAVATAGIVLATPVLFPFAVVVYIVLRPARPGDPARALELRLSELALGSGTDPDRCPGCRARVAQGWQRCPACGTALSRACPSCGEPAGLDWQLCAWCASELPWTRRDDPARPGAPVHTIPIVPGGRPFVPVMAMPDDEEPSRDAVAPAARARHRSPPRRRG